MFTGYPLPTGRCTVDYVHCLSPNRLSFAMSDKVKGESRLLSLEVPSGFLSPSEQHQHESQDHAVEGSDSDAGIPHGWEAVSSPSLGVPSEYPYSSDSQQHGSQEHAAEEEEVGSGSDTATPHGWEAVSSPSLQVPSEFPSPSDEEQHGLQENTVEDSLPRCSEDCPVCAIIGYFPNNELDRPPSPSSMSIHDNAEAEPMFCSHSDFDSWTDDLANAPSSSCSGLNQEPPPSSDLIVRCPVCADIGHCACCIESLKKRRKNDV